MKKTAHKIQKIIAQLKHAQEQLQKLVKDKEARAELRRQTRTLRQEVKKHLSGDVARVRAFLDLARGELESLQKQYLNPKGVLEGATKKIKKLARKSLRPKKKARTKRGKVVTAETSKRSQDGV